MTAETLKIINDTLTTAGIHYEFGQWNSDVVYPYFVGEYAEITASPEDSHVESSFTLVGFSREAWVDLETAKDTIERIFADKTLIADSGNGVSISYAGSTIIPTGDAELKRIEINLTIDEWKVNIYG